MKKNHYNKCKTLITILCMTLISHIVSAQWNVKLIGPGQIQVSINPPEIMGSVEVILLLTYNNEQTKQETYLFTNEQHKYLKPGNRYQRVFGCENSVKNVKGQDVLFIQQGGGELEDRGKARMGKSSGGPLTGGTIIVIRKKRRVN